MYLHDIHAKTNGESPQGFQQLLSAERRVSATTLQTVGCKGYDGFTLALVTSENSEGNAIAFSIASNRSERTLRKVAASSLDRRGRLHRATLLGRLDGFKR